MIGCTLLIANNQLKINSLLIPGKSANSLLKDLDSYSTAQFKLDTRVYHTRVFAIDFCI